MKSIWFALSLILVGSLTAQDKKDLDLKSIWGSPMFRPDYVSGLRSMNDGVHYTTLNNDRGGLQTIVQYSYEKQNEEKILVRTADLESTKGPFRIDGYQFSADEKLMLLSTETERIYRHSTREANFIYDLEKKTLTRLSEGKQRYATFSPDGSKVAFVRDNNLFVKDLKSGEESQLTQEGEMNKIIYGATDWVYEEEFAFDKAFFWSPGGSKIAFYRFDETLVPEFNMPMYKAELYPQDYRFKYPKAGEANSVVRVAIYDVNTKNLTRAQVRDYYIPRVKWSATDEYLTVTGMNRHQSELNLYEVNSSTGEARAMIQEQSETYIDIHDNLTFLEGNKGFIWTSEKSGYNHLYFYSKGGSKETQITQGDWEVTKVYGFDEKSGYIYFQAAKENPMEREVYRIKVKGSGLEKLSKNKGNNDASFSTGFKYFINYHSTANTPYVIDLQKSDGSVVRNLVDNQKLKDLLANYNLSPKEFFSFETSEKVTLNGWMIKPPNFDASKKYPVLMYVYGGPGSQTVQDSWGGSNFLWYQMMAQKGYLIVSVDNRGTGARGQDFKKMTYLQLGKYETMDQIEAAKYLQNQPYVQADRIGIWGWSYGGYMSSLCLFKGSDIFKMAMAVAPVTNWKFYDTIYTERYMRTPEENSGYEENSPISHVKKLKGKYLLIHGTADDNVHFQNSVEMVSALQKENKQFDLMIYPDKNHGIYGGKTRLHLFTLLTDYVERNL
ncbi:S9 family peptidase [bacterium SCSIO 12741]|nr:S9 family peptidase [bacterium SCSIO 12741]